MLNTLKPTILLACECSGKLFCLDSLSFLGCFIKIVLSEYVYPLVCFPEKFLPHKHIAYSFCSHTLLASPELLTHFTSSDMCCWLLCSFPCIVPCNIVSLFLSIIFYPWLKKITKWKECAKSRPHFLSHLFHDISHFSLYVSVDIWPIWKTL